MPGKAYHWLLASAASLLFFACGCQTPARVSSYPPPSPPPEAPCNRCGNSVPVPSRFTPTPMPASEPSNYYTPPSSNPPTDTPPVYMPPPSQSSVTPPSAKLAPPVPLAEEPARTDPPRDTAKLTPPQTVEPPPAVSIPNGSRPLVKNEPQASPRLPVDIPQFVQVKPRVAAGQQPFPDGVSWLQNEGYRTVLHIRSPGESDTAAQRIFEKRGLRYISLEVGPRNLTKETVEQFNKTVNDEANQSLFVFDHDSSLAGALWYLHFRTAGRMSDENARAEAARLGFHTDQDDNARTMWIAVQNYLRNQNP